MKRTIVVVLAALLLASCSTAPSPPPEPAPAPPPPQCECDHPAQLPLTPAKKKKVQAGLTKAQRILKSAPPPK